MAAAEDGFRLPNQRRGIAAQLRDGVRAFQIDAYLGSVQQRGQRRIVITHRAERKLASIAEVVGPALGRQVVRSRRIFAAPPTSTRQDVYLCHNFCELGAVKLSHEVEVLRRFLEQNPSDVLIIVIQDELPAEKLEPVFERGGLDRYIATIDPRRPLPTLGAMIVSGRRLLIGLEHGELGPRIPNVFDDGLVQEVPYHYRTAAELEAPGSCRPLRGRPGAPLFQFNNWITPASRRAARRVNSEEFLLARALRCADVRDRLPNLVAVDFYDAGDLFAVVEQLNASG